MQWHYQTQAGQRVGPVSTEAIRSLLETGALTGRDSVWRVGWSQWTPIASTSEFAAPVASPAVGSSVPVVPAVAQDVQTAMPVTPGSADSPAIAYFTPRVDMPARVLANLANHARPTGPTGEWPLNDTHIEQFAQAVRLRKRMLGSIAASRLLFAINAIASVVVFAVALGGRQSEMFAMLGAAGLYLLLGCLFYWFASAARRSRAWGSLVPAILATVLLAFTIAAYVFMYLSVAQNAPANLFLVTFLPAIIGSLIVLAFVVAFWRGFLATSKFLNTPVWCQEAVVVGEKSK
jgi:uncharacterized membrane protein YeaQ/YmgE (transglycosylase-associated protein family)